MEDAEMCAECARMVLEIEKLCQVIHVCKDYGCGIVHREKLPIKKMKVEKTTPKDQ
jgi:hypothetical protein